jgi:hypothetical protein
VQEVSECKDEFFYAHTLAWFSMARSNLHCARGGYTGTGTSASSR